MKSFSELVELGVQGGLRGCKYPPIFWQDKMQNLFGFPQMTGLAFFSCTHIFSDLPPAIQSKIVKGGKKYIFTKKLSSESPLVNILDGAV